VKLSLAAPGRWRERQGRANANRVEAPASIALKLLNSTVGFDHAARTILSILLLRTGPTWIPFRCMLPRDPTTAFAGPTP
jgi:hypothetical protein